jgi:hypothetical protein
MLKDQSVNSLINMIIGLEYNPVESMDEDSADEEVFKPRHLAPVYPHTPVY